MMPMSMDPRSRPARPGAASAARPGSARRAPVKSAARVLELFELFDKHRAPLSLKEITRRLGYPQSSATVLMKSLIALGYVNYDRVTRTYLPSLKIAWLGNWVRDDVIPASVYDLMRRLREATGKAIVLAVPNDIHVQYLRVMASERTMREFVSEAAMRPMSQSSFGWLFLSRLPADRVEKILRHINARERDVSRRVDIARLMERIEAMRGIDHCSLPNIPVPGTMTCAMLLPWQMHGRPLAIGMGDYVGQGDERDAIDRLRAGIAAYRTGEPAACHDPADIIS